MLLYDNTYQKLKRHHKPAEHLIHLVAWPFASSFPLIIPHTLPLVLYFLILSDIHLQQSTYPYFPRCSKNKYTAFPVSVFFFFSFMGNTWCRVKRTF